jgi:hypothetical protein
VIATDRACTRVPLPNFHGKEGVDGSSPSEGFAKVAAYRQLPFAIRTMNRMRDVHRTSTQLCNDTSIAALNQYLTALWLPIAASTERPRGGRGFLCGE